jgi:uncharacterized protein YprB with RNaseH-like and TPR domain
VASSVSFNRDSEGDHHCASDDFRERLSSLGKRRTAGGATTRGPARDGEQRSLDDLRGKTIRNDGVLVVERGLSELTSLRDRDALLGRLARAGVGIDARGDIDELVRTLIREPEGALFVDTETAGLGGNMIFMLGAMRLRENDLKVTQVFARDYGEERALLDEWVNLLMDASFVVSFNGKSFDLPMLRDRLGLHGIAAPDTPVHLDLLHHARRRWRNVLPDCRLQTLEWKICGRRRAGDIPGEEIPGVYHRYVRTGDASDILTVFHHNALDLVTLVDIAVALTAPEDEPA